MFVGLLAAKVVVVALGIFVAFQGYRAARRERSQRMLVVAGGFAFLSIGSVLEGICYELLQMSTLLAGIVQTCTVGLGMTLIVASLFVPAAASTSSTDPIDDPQRGE